MRGARGIASPTRHPSIRRQCQDCRALGPSAWCWRGWGTFSRRRPVTTRPAACRRCEQLARVAWARHRTTGFQHEHGSLVASPVHGARYADDLPRPGERVGTVAMGNFPHTHVVTTLPFGYNAPGSLDVMCWVCTSPLANADTSGRAVASCRGRDPRCQIAHWPGCRTAR